MVATVAAEKVHLCPGSGTFPDIVQDLVINERSYVCATCGATMPSFELSPLHEPRCGHSPGQNALPVVAPRH
jgi:hypothetical protein